MRLSSHIILCLTISVSMFAVYFLTKETFNEKHILRDQMAQLEKAAKTESFKRKLADHQLIAFQQEIAKLLPEVLKRRGKGEKGYPLRNLASVVYEVEETNVQDRFAEMYLEKAKRDFTQGAYFDAIAKFDKFIKLYPYSVKIVDAYYLKAESLFYTQQLDKCVQLTKSMVELFPENEMTGLALLKVGKIYEFQDRPEDAVKLYQTLLRSFPYPSVAERAHRSISSVSL